jgi:hypothetical protein
LGEGYVHVPTIRKWCHDRGIAFQSLIARADAEGYILKEPGKPNEIQRKIVLGRGVAGNARVSSRVIAFNLQRLGMQLSDVPAEAAQVIPMKGK